MNTLNNFLFEKLKIDKNIVILDKEHWKLENAKAGDFIKCFTNIYYIFKCFNKNYQYISTCPEDTIIFYACYIDNSEQNIFIGPLSGVGGLSRGKFHELATEEEREKFLKALEKEGYKWDENKLEVVKI